MNRSLYSITAAAMIALSSAAFLPQAAMAQVGVNVVIGNAPPPPRYEAVPQARRGYVWAPGYWNWDGQRHVWTGGQWIQERGGNQYRHAEWVRENNQWRLDRGGWIAVSQPVRYEEIRIAPPAPRYERMPQARRGYVWSPGHWEWRGRRYDWAPGVWIAERPGHVYVAPAWNQRDGRWVMEQGRWNERGPNGDRDHDGIPNRYDHNNNGRDNNGRPHDRDGDGVPNRFDNTPPRPGDRDGDGVPNRNDSRPDNPRRN